MDRLTAIVLIAAGAVSIAGLGILVWYGLKEYRRMYNNNEEGKHGK